MKKKYLKQLLVYLLLTAGIFVVVMPMIYMISTSIKPNGALYEFPPRFLPRPEQITFGNYQYVIGQGKFYINFLNSILVSVVTVLVAAFVASALGFCIARFKFFGKNFLIQPFIASLLPR